MVILRAVLSPSEALPLPNTLAISKSLSDRLKWTLVVDSRPSRYVLFLVIYFCVCFVGTNTHYGGVTDIEFIGYF